MPLLPGVVERDVRPSPRGAADGGDAVPPAQPVRRREGGRLLVDDEPFDVRYGQLLSHERVLDLRAGTLARRAEWASPAGDCVRVRSTRLVSFSQRAVGAILRGEQDELRLGNLDARRDWGYARDYMEGAWQMLQAEEPDDYVLATGETHSVQEFLDEAFDYAGLDWREYVRIDSRYFRPAEVDVLMGDYTKAREKLGWEPTVRFHDLVRMMVDADRERARIEEHYL